MATVKTTVKINAFKLRPTDKARWVNKWNEFHKAFPNITMKDWCESKGLNASTFWAWGKDPKYNKELREELGIKTRTDRYKDKQRQKQVQKEDVIESSSEPINELEEPAKDSEDGVEVKTEVKFFDKEQEYVLKSGSYVSFISPEFKIDISRAMPIQDINMILGYLFHCSKKIKDEEARRKRRNYA